MKNEKAESIRPIVAETPYFIGSFVFLDGDTVLRVGARFVPQGILRRMLVYSHTSEDNHEDVYFRVYANGAQIVPMAWSNDARAYIPVPTIGKFIDFDLNYPCASEIELEVELNQAPSNGVTFIFIYEPLKISRERFKAMIKSYETDLMEVST